jgi:N-acetyl-gamma-glutamyl-phosphate reductase
VGKTMARVAIEGASGYGGMELTRLLARHPEVEVVGVGSGRWAGSAVHERLGLSGAIGQLVYRQALEDLDADVVLLATPAEASLELAERWAGRARVIDLSNAHRARAELPAAEQSERDASGGAAAARWVYSIPELHRAGVGRETHVANPGCYPTATQLALVPLIRAGLLGPGPLIIDAKSGATGAGRSNADTLLFNELADNHYPYKVGSHQHVPEIERALGREVVFTPHLIPCRRGLMISAYAPVASGVGPGDLEACLRAAYADEPFVSVVQSDASLGIGTVAHSPCARVSVGPTLKTGMARVFGSIDNLLKGAASQAVQNLNLVLGFPETAGIL